MKIMLPYMEIMIKLSKKEEQKLTPDIHPKLREVSDVSVLRYGTYLIFLKVQISLFPLN